MPTTPLRYHSRPPAGKIQVVATKPCLTARDLALAYTPGVAVLALGNLGALAAKPVMEGKAVLFKVFADIDVFDMAYLGLIPSEYSGG